MLSIRLETLGPERKRIFDKLKIFKNKGYLAGGTALSLQLKHRHSFDFDIFLRKELKRTEYLLLKKNFFIKEVILNTSEQLTVMIENNINITLVFYPHKNLFSLIRTNSLPLLSLKDIVLDKAFTIGRRGIWRDYVDIFFLLKKKYISLSNVIKLAKKKFKEEFNEKLFLGQLSYFEDLGKFKISFIAEKYSKEEVKKYLTSEIKKYQLSLIQEFYE